MKSNSLSCQESQPIIQLVKFDLWWIIVQQHNLNGAGDIQHGRMINIQQKQSKELPPC